MPIVDPLGSVERAILARLQDEDLGLIASFKELVKTPDYEGLDALAFDFNPEGTNFGLGIVDPPVLISTTDFEFPFLMLQATSAAQDQGPSRIKGIPFSGNVQAALRVLLSYEQSAVTDFSTMPNAVAAAMVATFNYLPPNVDPTDYPWSPGILYNGGISVQRSRPMKGGDNWVVVLDFQASFYAVIQ